MGYYTIFTLTILDEKREDLQTDSPLYAKIVKDFYRMWYNMDDSSEVEEEYARKLLERFVYDGFEAKWYKYQHDMKELARKYPTCYFVLEGVGENREDWWREGYHGNDFNRTEAYVQEPGDPLAGMED